MSLRRPLTLRLNAVGDNNVLSTKDVIEGLKDVVSVDNVKYVTQTGKNSWQLTFSDERARDNVLACGTDIQNNHYICHTITGERRPPTYVDVKLPYEILDGVVKSLLSIVTACWLVFEDEPTPLIAPTIETGVRIFTVMESIGTFPTSVTTGQYVLPLYVRYAGQPPRCYRCGSDQHRIGNVLNHRHTGDAILADLKIIYTSSALATSTDLVLLRLLSI